MRRLRVGAARQSKLNIKSYLATLLSLSIAGIAALMTPAVASACTPTHHCYGLAEWNVEGKTGSGFKGSDMILQSYEDALYTREQEGYDNLITNESWVVFEHRYWNEAGDVIGCVYIIGCTGSSPQYFAFFDSKGDGEGGALSSQGPGSGQFEVQNSYYAPTNGWYVHSGTFTGGINGQPSYALALEAGVETTTTSAYNYASATNLDWEDLQGGWHYSDWASGTGHAEIYLQPSRPSGVVYQV